MKQLLLLFSLMIILGCNSKSDQTTDTATDQEQDSQLITAKDIDDLEYTEYVLGPDAKQAVINWQRYQELTMQIDYLKKADFSFFGGENELMMTFLKDLKDGIPQQIASPAIKERLIALETKLLKLHSTLKLSNSEKSELLNNIKELLVATSNLHLQINKKFELESQIIEDPTVDRTIQE